jgi:dTMP kinase
MSIFITFEGVEGCGKSTQTKIFYKRLTDLAIPALLTHEPGGTLAGEKITRILKWSKDQHISPITELMLFNASRAQLSDTIIKPSLEQGIVVVSDRFTDSTIAYQGYGRGLDIGLIKSMNSTATGGLKPNLTVLLDLPVEEGLKRKSSVKQDRFHREDIEFHKRVRNGFLTLVSEEPDRWLVIDARDSKSKIAAAIWQKTIDLLAV